MSRKLYPSEARKIRAMLGEGFSDLEISRALHVARSTVTSFRNGDQVDSESMDQGQLSSNSLEQESENDESLTEEEETDLQIYEMIHSGCNDSEIAQEVGISEDTVRNYRSDQKNAYEEDSEDIQEEPKQINFVGGTKHLEKEEEPEEKKEFEWECESCHGEFDGKPERCPHCGSELEWSDGSSLWPVLVLGGLGLVGYLAHRHRINNQNWSQPSWNNQGTL